MPVTPDALDNLIGPARTQVSRLTGLAQQLRSAGPDEQAEIIAQAQAAARALTGAADELNGALNRKG